MTKINDTLFREYAELNKKLEELEGRKEEIRAQLKQSMEDADLQQYKDENGTFFLKAVRLWKYSGAVEGLVEKIKDQNDKLKELKAKEQESGIAKEDGVAISFNFRAIKEKE